MITNISKFFVSIFILITGTNALAQMHIIPFELSEHYMFIKVTVNERKDTLHFIFDTGASATIMDANTASKLGLKPSSTSSALGSSGAAGISIISNQKLKTSTLVLNEISFGVLDLSSLNYVLNHHVDGIIGRDIYEKGICRVDFDRHTISLFSNLNEIKERGTKIDFTLDFGPIPAVEASFSIATGETLTGKFLFDCGAGITYKLNTPFVQKNKLPEKVGKYITSRASGVGNNPESIQVFRSAKFNLATFEFSGVPGLLSSTRAGVSSMDRLAGLLGNQIIQRFNFVLDYDNRHIYLKPSHHFNDNFEVDLCGFRLKQRGDGIYALRVNEESKAYKAGIREGVKLLEINGIRPTSVSFANAILRKPGTIVTVVFSDVNGTKKTIGLELELPF